MWDLTAEVIRNWDPEGLLAGGAPRDELDHEIASLVAQIPRIKSAADAALAVSGIFGSNFDSDIFPAESCRDVGEKLFTPLLEKGLLS